jgi:hypothetical protein
MRRVPCGVQQGCDLALAARGGERGGKFLVISGQIVLILGKENTMANKEQKSKKEKKKKKQDKPKKK